MEKVVPKTTNATLKRTSKGILGQSTSVYSLTVTGKVRINPIKNNHFIIVTVLYFSERGFTTMIKPEKKTEFIINKIFPISTFGALPVF